MEKLHVDEIEKSLWEMARSSKTEIIEVAADTELAEIAKKNGINLPNPDIAILKTVYAEVNVANRNGVRLPREAVIKALPTLRLKQANWSHLGKNFICGFIIDGKLEGEEIIIYTAIYKSLFVDEFDKVRELFEKKDLAVSFEIWSVNPENMEPVVKFNADGTRTIDPIIFHGVGILIEDGEKPACPKAYAQKLLAILNKSVLDGDENEKIKKVDFSENLIYAKSDVEEDNVEVIAEDAINGKPKTDEERAKNHFNISDEEWNKLSKEEKQEYIDKLPPRGSGKANEEGQEEVKELEEITEPKVEEQKVEPIASEETKVEDIVPAVETKPEEIVETPKEVVAEVVAPVRIVKQIIEEKYITEETYAEDGSYITLKRGMIVRITELSDGKKDVTEEEFADVVKYSQAELDAQAVAIKAELEKTYNEQLGIKDTEIATLKAEVEVKKTEITTIKTEQAAVIEEAEKDLGVGSVNVEENDKDIAVQHRVTAQAFPVKK